MSQLDENLLLMLDEVADDANISIENRKDDPEEQEEEQFEDNGEVYEEQGFEYLGEQDYLEFEDLEYDQEPELQVLLPPPQEPEIDGEDADNFAQMNQFLYQDQYTEYDPNDLQPEDGNEAYPSGYDQGYVPLPLRGYNLCKRHEVGGEDYEPKIHIDYEQDFQDNIMTIPEQEGIDALDRAAEVSDVKDDFPLFLGEEEMAKEGYVSAETYISPTTPVFYRCPSIESFFRQGVANVHLYLEPGKKMIGKEIRLDTTIFELKDAVSRYARILPEMLDLRMNHSLLTNTKTLADLGVKANTKVRFTVELNTRMEHAHPVTGLPLVLKIPDLNDAKLPYRPDTVRHVNIQVDVNAHDMYGGETVHDELTPMTQQRKVIIVHPTEKKPMIGGFKNKLTGITYHDATTMTTSTLEEETGAEKFEEVGQLTCGTGIYEVLRRLKKPNQRII